MTNYYVVVKYRMLIPSGMGPGEDDLGFSDYASAQDRAERMQEQQPSFWWRVETRAVHDGPQV